MRKRHELYQEGFLCLFDTQGEMFFRMKTVIRCAYFHGGWALATAHRALHLEQEATYSYPIAFNCYEDPEPYACTELPMAWQPTWMDAAFLHDGNEEIDEFCFIGHFDISWENKNKLVFSFGEGYMADTDGTTVLSRAAEDWEYQHCDSELFGTINMDKLRVVID
jgi:hypothetical protein